MVKWLSEGLRLLAVAIIFATLVGAWMFRYEQFGPSNNQHRNRFTGVICYVTHECWLANSKEL